MSTASDTAKVPGIFDHLASEGQVALLRNRSGVYEVDIEDDGGRWFLILDHGTPALIANAEHPDCVITCNASDFVAIAEGNQNLVTAFLQGRVTCTGDLAFAIDFRRLLPVAA
jgi:predicted lipid carrier protein YhbT